MRMLHCRLAVTVECKPVPPTDLQPSSAGYTNNGLILHIMLAAADLREARQLQDFWFTLPYTDLVMAAFTADQGPALGLAARILGTATIDLHTIVSAEDMGEVKIVAYMVVVSMLVAGLGSAAQGSMVGCMGRQLGSFGNWQYFKHCEANQTVLCEVVCLQSRFPLFANQYSEAYQVDCKLDEQEHRHSVFHFH